MNDLNKMWEEEVYPLIKAMEEAYAKGDTHKGDEIRKQLIEKNILRS